MSQSKNTLPPSFKPPHLLSGLRADEPILVGFSGGSDSTALLNMLRVYAKESGAKIYAAHVNHGIRGEEADRDENFCRDFAQRLGIGFFSLRINVPQIAKNTSESIETAARRERYEYFERLMRENNIKILATAHNADDNLETIIFNITRGTALSGACGIPDRRPCECGVVIRPILGMEKSEILSYCKDNQLDYVTDSTNTDTDYTRNKIRAQIIPIMKQINSGAVRNAARMSETLREDSLCLEGLVDDFIAELNCDCAIELKKFSSSHAAVVNRALVRIYSVISGGNTLEQVHINALRSLAQNAVPHSSVSLPKGIEGVIENGKLCFRRKSELGNTVEDYLIELNEGRNIISQTNCEIFIGPSHSSKNIYKKSILMSIDSAKINGAIIVRRRQSGDKIRMGGMSKSVKKLMCDKKIPLDVRSRIPMICDNDGILAIPFVGIRDNAKYKDEKSSDSSKTDIGFYLN